MQVLQENTLEEEGLVEFGTGTSKGRGYFVAPRTAHGGVLVLHAWWGLNDFFKSLCDRFAAEGYAALAPDLREGKVARTPSEAKELMEKSNEELVQKTVLGGLDYLRSHPSLRGRRIGVVGFSMGAGEALWLSIQKPSDIAAVVAFYGAGELADFSKTHSSYLGHFVPEDEWEQIDYVRSLEEKIRQGGRPVTFHYYPGTRHWFFENDRTDAFDPQASQLAWTRTLEFLRANLLQTSQE